MGRGAGAVCGLCCVRRAAQRVVSEQVGHGACGWVCGGCALTVTRVLLQC